MAGNHNLGTVRGTIEIDYDGAGIVRAIKDVDKAKGSGDKLDGMANKVLGSFTKLSGGFLKAGGIIGNVQIGLQAVAGALAAVGPLAAAAFAAAPALILGYASTLVIAKVAVAGVGDAMATAAEGGKKFDEAMKKLSPEAQNFVKEYRKTIPVLDEVKKSIQDAFFKGTASAVGGVVSRVASLRPQAQDVAFFLSQIAQNIIKTAANGRNIEGLRRILAGVGSFLEAIRKSIGPVVTGFISIGAQAAGLGGTLGGALARGLEAFSIWLNKVDVKAVFAEATPIIKGIGSLLSDIGAILGHVFGLFTADGADAVGVLGELISSLRSFLDSAQGQEVLRALGEAMQAIATGAGQVFTELLLALTPALIALLPAVTQLAGQLSGVLVTAIQILNPLLQGLANFLADNVSWVGPLLIAVVGLAAAYKVYAAAAVVVRTVQAALNSAMVVSTLGWIRNTAAIVASRVAMLASVVAMGAVRAATIAWTVVQWALNSAFLANPITLIVLLIVGLIAIIYKAYTSNERFRQIVQAVWAAIKAAIAAVLNWITGTLWPSLKKTWEDIANAAQTLWGWIKTAWNGILTAIKFYLNGIKTIATTVWNFIVGYIRFQINLVRTIITAVVNGIRATWNAWLNGIRVIARTVWTAIVNFIGAQIGRIKAFIAGVKTVITVMRNIFNGVLNAVRDRINLVISTVRGLPGRVISALGNIGRLLYNKGVSLVQGFISGIASMIGRVRDVASNVVSAVTDFLPGSPAKEGPLSGRGYALLRARRMMGDLAQGINDGSEGPAKAMAGAVAPMSRAMVPVGSRTHSESSAMTSALAAASGTREYTIQVGDKTLAKMVVDAVTGNPVAVAKASNEGTRRDAWAGSGR